jgi:multiple sugar transport system permease protein
VTTLPRWGASTNARTQAGNHHRGRRLLTHAVIIVAGIAMIYPLIWMIASSFKPDKLIFTEPGLWSSTWTLQNYVDGWNQIGLPFGLFLFNSLIISVACVVGNLFSCTLAAYAFSRLRFRGSGAMFAFMLVTIMLPFQVILVPQYILFQTIGWTNTFLPLIVPKFLGVDSFFIFLMVQFIRGIPRELDEAATVDGCGPIQIFWRVVLPLMRPALAVTAVFTFIWTWNDFLTPLLYLTDQAKFTAPVGLNAFIDSTGVTSYGPMFAMAILSLIPLFIVFLLAQRQLVQGVATTGLK